MTLPTDSQWTRYSALCARLRPLPSSARAAALQGLRATGAEDPQVLSLVAFHFTLPPDPLRDRTGERLGSCTLEAPLGAGGMGVVYRAQQHLGAATRPVAVKLLHPTLLLAAREEALARFLAELQTLALLQHEGIARLYEGGLYDDPHTHESCPYLAMELVPGGLPITTYAQDYALPWQERLALMVRVCQAVRYAHEHRVVHRDLKPANILVDHDGRPVIIDFGLASACDAVLPGVHLAAAGTPAYMSPEQVSAAWGPPSDKSDVYALGLMLYELLTGQRPYTLPRDGSWEQLCDVITTALPRPLGQHQPAYQGELEAIVAQALAKRPTDRCSVAVLRARLERALQQWSTPAAVSPLAPVPSEPPPVQGPASGPRAAGLRPPEAERRQLTVLFCDVVDSTALASQLDPEDLRAVVQAYHAACAEVIRRFDGHIAQLLGDGLLVYFGYPQAHEDEAQRAARTGLGMVEALGALNTRLEREHGIRVAVRVGIHTGLVVVGTIGEGRQEQLALGETPNIAARLQGLAAPDTVVISAATARLVAGYFVCQPLGAHALKGVSHPLQVSRVLRASGAQTRLDVVPPHGLTPLVGRDEEVALLHRRWEQATMGTGQVVLLSGEPGIGKSRLVQVLKEHVAATPHTRIEWRGSPDHQQSALYPVIDQLHRRLRWRPDAPPSETLHTLEALLASSGVGLSEAVPLLAALLSLPLPASSPPLTLTPQQQRQHTFDTLLAWLHADAQRQPVLLVVEDLHWLDPSTLELLSLLMDQGAQARLCLILTARPEFHPAWAMVAHLTTLTLRRLAPDHVARVATHVAGDKTLPPAVLQEVVRKTDGVPLFVEELTKTVLESGLLQEHEEHYALPGPLPPLAIPATLQDALLARLDRLGAAKGVTQLGATIGRTFTYDLLLAVAPLDAATLPGALAQLVEAEVVAQRGLPPQATYTFKHALIQETAYQSLLKSTRRHYHQRIAQVLQAQFPETAEGQPELLAYHALRGEVWDKAVTYCQQAGARAHDRAAFREAVASYEQALQALAYLPEDGDTRVLAIELRLALARSLRALGEFGRYRVLLSEAEALARALDDRARLVRVLAGIAHVLMVTGDLDSAMAAGQQALALAAALGEHALQAQASLYLGRVYQVISDFGRAVELLRWSVEAADREPGTPSTDVRIESRAWLAVTLGALGAFAEGRRHGEEALRLATLEGRGSTPITVHACLGFLYLNQGDLEHAIRLLEQGLALCRASGNRDWLLTITASLGYASALKGCLAEGRALLEEGLSESIRTGVRQGHSRWGAWLSAVCRLAGRYDEAWQHARQAIELARQQKARGTEAHALYQLGAVHAHIDPPNVAQAEAHYQQAMALAAELGMRPLQAHCHLGLGTLYATTGQREQARAELSTAIEMYRAMEMTFWLPQTEAALTQVEGR